MDSKMSSRLIDAYTKEFDMLERFSSHFCLSEEMIASSEELIR